VAARRLPATQPDGRQVTVPPISRSYELERIIPDIDKVLAGMRAPAPKPAASYQAIADALNALYKLDPPVSKATIRRLCQARGIA